MGLNLTRPNNYRQWADATELAHWVWRAYQQSSTLALPPASASAGSSSAPPHAPIRSSPASARRHRRLERADRRGSRIRAGAPPPAAACPLPQRRHRPLDSSPASAAAAVHPRRRSSPAAARRHRPLERAGHRGSRIHAAASPPPHPFRVSRWRLSVLVSTLLSTLILGFGYPPKLEIA